VTRSTELRPAVGTVTEDKFDKQDGCRRKTWVSNISDTKAALKVTYTTTRHYKAGTGHHDFYTDDIGPDDQRTCHFCKCSESKPGTNHFNRPVLVKRDWNEKCPVEQLHRHTSTQSSQKYLVIAGPQAGKRLTEADAGDGFVSYNRSSRWGKSDEVPKVVLIPLAALKGK
jgi:hypothetical protein